MIKKRSSPFLILEVLIAFMLIAMTILPFSSFPYKVFSKELKLLETMTMEPYFTDAFFKAYEQKEQEEWALDPIEIPFGEKDTLYVKRQVKIQRTEISDPLTEPLINIELTFSSKNTTVVRKKLFFNTKRENNL